MLLGHRIYSPRLSETYKSKETCLPIYNAKEFVQGLSDEYGGLIANKKVQALLDKHTSNSLTVPFFPPFTPNTFLRSESEDLRNYFNSVVNAGFGKITTEAVVQEDCVLHEIGIVNPPEVRYYNRWAKEGGEWKIQYENLLFQPPQQS